MGHCRRISVIGLGYVGLPVAAGFGKKGAVVGFDIDGQRVEELKRGYDHTGEVDEADLAASDIWFTAEPQDLKRADFHIVAVPTPIDEAKRPNLDSLLQASRTVGEQLKPGDIVVYESTVYPGATEEECIPVLEQASGLKSGIDFTVGYSPERINPGDRVHTFASITKVVSGQDSDTLAKVAAVYESVIAAGVHRSPSIKVAEAAKVIENTQRDLNIALMNELALIFERFGLDTGDVLAAAGSKWNFLRFRPGLVGGHCIGVDPHYLTHKAIVAGYHPQVILAGRRINDEMGKFIASRVVKCLIRKGYNIKESTVTVLGLTFKEDVPDLRNTRVIDIVRELQDYGMRVQVQDPLVDRDEAQTEYGIEVANELDVLAPAQAVVLAVSHRLYVEQAWDLVAGLLRDQSGVVVDVKGVLEREAVPGGISLWRL